MRRCLSFILIFMFIVISLIGCKGSSEEGQSEGKQSPKIQQQIDSMKKDIEDSKNKINEMNEDIKKMKQSIDQIEIAIGMQTELVDVSNEAILNFALEVLQVIKAKEYAKLNQFIDDKMLISPNAYPAFGEYEIYITKGNAEWIENHNEKVIWGYHGGSGELIQLTPKELFEQYIYKEDYINAPQVSVNEIIKSSYGGGTDLVMENIIHNHFVEFHFPGFEPKYEGMDWTSLRMLIKQNENGDLYVTAIYIDHWEI